MDIRYEQTRASRRDYAAQQGWQVTCSYSDRAASGASMFSPGIEQMQRDAKAGRFDVVLAEAMDRMSRNLADIAKFHERMEHCGIEIWALTVHKVDQMMIVMKGTRNAVMRRDIDLKTLRGQRGRVKEGKIPDGHCYGYDVLLGIEVRGHVEYGNRAANPEQAAVIQRIFEDYARGLSPKTIAAALNIKRIAAPRGGH